MTDRASAGASPRAVLAVMCTGYFLVLLDVTIVNVALPSIGSATGAGTDGLQWVVDGYAVALASLMLGGGSIGDRVGHRRVVQTGFALFGVASLACGLAPGVETLVAARALQGVGAALLLPGTLAIITRAFPDAADRAKAIGIWAGVGGVALPAGPLVGGALVQGLGWRAVFLINIPVVAGVLIATARTVRESADPDAPPVDVRGVALGAVALAALTFTVIDAGAAGLAVPVVVGAVVALAASIALVRAERAAENPLLPPATIGERRFALPNIAAGVMNLSTLGLLFVVSLFLQDVRGLSALHAGVALLPLFLPLALIAPLSGRLIARRGHRPAILAGLAITAAGYLALTMVGAGSAYVALLPAFLLWGLGNAILTPGVVAGAVAAVPAARAGFASAANNTARQAGGAIGIAAFGAIAGSAAQTRSFVSGMHHAALIATGLFVVVAIGVATLPSPPAEPGPASA